MKLQFETLDSTSSSSKVAMITEGQYIPKLELSSSSSQSLASEEEETITLASSVAYLDLSPSSDGIVECQNIDFSSYQSQIDISKSYLLKCYVSLNGLDFEAAPIKPSKHQGIVESFSLVHFFTPEEIIPGSLSIQSLKKILSLSDNEKEADCSKKLIVKGKSFIPKNNLPDGYKIQAHLDQIDVTLPVFCKNTDLIELILDLNSLNTIHNYIKELPVESKESQNFSYSLTQLDLSFSLYEKLKNKSSTKSRYQL